MPNKEQSIGFSREALSQGSYEAAVHDFGEVPERYEEIWQQLSRTNPELALSMLDAAKHAVEVGEAPDRAMLHGAMILLHAVNKQRTSEAAMHMPPDLEIVNDGQPDAVATAPQRHRSLWRTKAAVMAFFALKTN